MGHNFLIEIVDHHGAGPGKNQDKGPDEFTYVFARVVPNFSNNHRTTYCEI